MALGRASTSAVDQEATALALRVGAGAAEYQNASDNRARSGWLSDARGGNGGRRRVVRG